MKPANPGCNRRLQRFAGIPGPRWFPFFIFLTFSTFSHAADDFLKINEASNAYSPSQDIAATPVNLKEPTRSAPAIILKADRFGHFRGMATINDMPMPFLIDTGATKTSIPINLAIAAHLPFGQSIQSNTAGGHTLDRQTKINKLKLGNIEIKNLDANINQHLNEVLIGMNTLKYFYMLQNANTLTLAVNDTSLYPQNSQPAKPASGPVKQKPFSLKKSVICDERKVCKTLYSDH